MDDWQELRDAFPNLDDNRLLDAQEAILPADGVPNFGFRREHKGERTLRDFFTQNGMSLPAKPATEEFKFQRAIAGNVPVPDGHCMVLAYNESGTVTSQFPMLTSDADELFGDEPKVYVMGQVIDGKIHTDAIPLERYW